MQRAVEAIREGRRILVFPEGTRSSDGRLQAFKKGGFHLAVDAQVPILPVAVNGSRKLLRKGEFVISPGVIEVVVCQPIVTRGLDSGDVPGLMARTREAILEARTRDPDFPDGVAASVRST